MGRTTHRSGQGPAGGRRSSRAVGATVDPAGAAQEWSGRPVAARLLEGVVFALPIVVSLATTYILVRVLPTPETTRQTVAWWVILAGIATIVLAGTDRFGRRFLPLAALLKMSLSFPERAPSRLRIAMRASDADRLQQRIEELRRNGMGATPFQAAEKLLELVGMLNAHDHRTRGHSERVRAYTAMIATELRLPKADLNRLQWAALLHDVGKLFVPVELLDKPGRLDDDEFQVIKRHPQWGAELVAPLVPWLGEWALAVPQHHERWDGGGYPRGLKGTEISFAARIVSVADTYDVMTSTRSYREALSTVEARRELARCSGTQFDPDVVRAFLRLSIGRQRVLAGPLTWLAQIPLLSPVAASAGAVSPAVVVTSSGAGVSVGLAVANASPSIQAESEAFTDVEEVAALLPAPEPPAPPDAVPSPVVPVVQQPAASPPVPPAPLPTVPAAPEGSADGAAPVPPPTSPGSAGEPVAPPSVLPSPVGDALPLPATTVPRPPSTASPAGGAVTTSPPASTTTSTSVPPTTPTTGVPTDQSPTTTTPTTTTTTPTTTTTTTTATTARPGGTVTAPPPPTTGGG